jgi:hypothetical protein
VRYRWCNSASECEAKRTENQRTVLVSQVEHEDMGAFICRAASGSEGDGGSEAGGEGFPELWFEVVVSALRHPASDEQLVMVTQVVRPLELEKMDS